MKKTDYSKFTTKELKDWKRSLRKEFHQPHNRKMNGKPTHDAFEKYGKIIYEIEHELMKRFNPELMKEVHEISYGKR